LNKNKLLRLVVFGKFAITTGVHIYILKLQSRVFSATDCSAVLPQCSILHCLCIQTTLLTSHACVHIRPVPRVRRRVEIRRNSKVSRISFWKLFKTRYTVRLKLPFSPTLCTFDMAPLTTKISRGGILGSHTQVEYDDSYRCRSRGPLHIHKYSQEACVINGPCTLHNGRGGG
jgi:hypothetical protein